MSDAQTWRLLSETLWAVVSCTSEGIAELPYGQCFSQGLHLQLLQVAPYIKGLLLIGLIRKKFVFSQFVAALTL